MEWLQIFSQIRFVSKLRTFWMLFVCLGLGHTTAYGLLNETYPVGFNHFELGSNTHFPEHLKGDYKRPKSSSISSNPRSKEIKKDSKVTRNPDVSTSLSKGRVSQTAHDLTVVPESLMAMQLNPHSPYQSADQSSFVKKGRGLLQTNLGDDTVKTTGNSSRMFSGSATQNKNRSSGGTLKELTTSEARMMFNMSKLNGGSIMNRNQILKLILSGALVVPGAVSAEGASAKALIQSVKEAPKADHKVEDPKASKLTFKERITSPFKNGWEKVKGYNPLARATVESAQDALNKAQDALKADPNSTKLQKAVEKAQAKFDVVQQAAQQAKKLADAKVAVEKAQEAWSKATGEEAKKSAQDALNKAQAHLKSVTPKTWVKNPIVKGQNKWDQFRIDRNLLVADKLVKAEGSKLTSEIITGLSKTHAGDLNAHKKALKSAITEHTKDVKFMPKTMAKFNMPKTVKGKGAAGLAVAAVAAVPVDLGYNGYEHSYTKASVDKAQALFYSKAEAPKAEAPKAEAPKAEEPSRLERALNWIEGTWKTADNGTLTGAASTVVNTVDDKTWNIGSSTFNHVNNNGLRYTIGATVLGGLGTLAYKKSEKVRNAFGATLAGIKSVFNWTKDKTVSGTKKAYNFAWGNGHKRKVATTALATAAVIGYANWGKSKYELPEGDNEQVQVEDQTWTQFAKDCGSSCADVSGTNPIVLGTGAALTAVGAEYVYNKYANKNTAAKEAKSSVKDHSTAAAPSISVYRKPFNAVGDLYSAAKNKVAGQSVESVLGKYANASQIQYGLFKGIVLNQKDISMRKKLVDYAQEKGWVQHFNQPNQMSELIKLTQQAQ